MGFGNSNSLSCFSSRVQLQLHSCENQAWLDALELGPV